MVDQSILNLSVMPPVTVGQTGAVALGVSHDGLDVPVRARVFRGFDCGSGAREYGHGSEVVLARAYALPYEYPAHHRWKAFPPAD